VVYFSGKALEMIKNSLGSKEYETGGMLGSNNDDVIDTFFYDEGRGESKTDYYPYVELWQRKLAEWDASKITFRGIIHSHVNNDKLSDRDIKMAREILRINSLQSILMPIFLINRAEIVWYEVGMDFVRNLDSKVVIN